MEATNHHQCDFSSSGSIHLYYHQNFEQSTFSNMILLLCRLRLGSHVHRHKPSQKLLMPNIVQTATGFHAMRGYTVLFQEVSNSHHNYLQCNLISQELSCKKTDIMLHIKIVLDFSLSNQDDDQASGSRLNPFDGALFSRIAVTVGQVLLAGFKLCKIPQQMGQPPPLPLVQQFLLLYPCMDILSSFYREWIRKSFQC